MSKRKLNWTCSYCSKIFRNPIILSCDDSICSEHLFERDVVRENKIKCKECNEEFEVKNNQFKSNKGLKKLTESHSYLRSKELRLKQQLEISIKKFYQYYDEFIHNQSKLESDVFDHFQEMRFQIDEHREMLRENNAEIDDIALAMIDETKKYEVKYLNSLREKLLEPSSFEETKSLETELNLVEDTFRDPNLLIETIQKMQQKQDEFLKDIQLKLNEMNQVKDHLKETNYFKPNLSSFDHNETSSLFGSIKFKKHPSTNSLKSSQILNGEQQSIQLIKLCQFSPNDSWSLLYRGTRDGFGSNDFHSRCDGHSNTLTILKAKESKFIFGGYTTIDWVSSVQWRSDPNAFLFSLTNKDNTPLKMKIDPNSHHHAIRCNSSCGPSFGGVLCNDIHIASNANIKLKSYSNLGDSYKHPRYECVTHEALSFLAGSFYFLLDEIEVHQKE
jgi:hypothetical protein